MKVIAYDPYVQAGRAAQMGVRLVTLDELLAESDFMSVHLPKTPETVGLIGDEELAKVKPSLVLVNAARGGIVDEDALHDALKEGRIAAAGLDVFAKEPCTDSPLFEFENVVGDPAPRAPPPTRPRRRPASPSPGRCAWRSRGELVPDAVNVQGGVIAEDVRPGIPLTEKLGRIFTALAGEVAQQLDVEVRGEITAVRRQGARARRPQGRLHRRRRGPGLLRQRAAARGRARHRRTPGHRRRRAPTTAT